VLACDALQSGLCVVLSHKISVGSECPVAFASRTLSPAEKNYILELTKKHLPVSLV
jgi:hypothetical protein